MALFDVKGWNISTNEVAIGGADPKKSKKKLKKQKNPKPDNDSELSEQPRQKRSNDSEQPEKVSKKAKKDRKQPMDTKKSTELDKNDDDVVPIAESAPVIATNSKLTPLQQKMMAKLSGSRFRWINEQLYTTTSEKALDLVKKQPELFDEYHQGFRSQVQNWPENPVDVFVEQVKSRTSKPINAPGGLPGNSKKQVVIADMGCGEAQFALDINNFVKQYNSQKKPKGKKVYTSGPRPPTSLDIKVHSFDLKKANNRITVADIKNVPLETGSCNIVIFCLALMGTNFLDFIKEAYRILAPNGELWIAEIKSRFSESSAGSKPQRPEDVGQEFVDSLKLLGFFHKKTDNENTMFTRFEFFKPSREIIEQQKNNRKRKFVELESKKEELELKREKVAEGKWLLKPCIYKRR